ncbi:DUF4334 domain-containing protein [Gordonia shandongensis]|uniref:DUF4334 domain-containing protein n=1 Tax=Gordonia shandongensis TaxID=376351 RepID=UPI0004232511|nr:DUF4334 domain-containing protein [Gordonia shandongensis]
MPSIPDTPRAVDALDELRRLQRTGCTLRQAAEFFDSLPAAEIGDLTPSRFTGSELPTGHLFDGMLTDSGWYGKSFRTADNVQPLLFSAGEAVFAINPILLPPLTIASRTPRIIARGFKRSLPALRHLVGTRKAHARLRAIDHNGVETAAMVYDSLPIIDVFKKVSADTFLGLMDYRGTPDPYFFVIDRDHPALG